MKASPHRGAVRAVAAVWALLVLTATGAPKPASAPAPIAYEGGKEIARLANPAITESSGLAASRLAEGVFWTHNDSGDSPRLFAFNRKGEDLGAYPVHGATAVDWEDMAAFSLGKQHYLLIADVGDNFAARKSCTLYFLAEPLVKARPAKPAALPVAIRMDFSYEDGPRNCESAAVDPVRKEILLVSKTGGNSCKAYLLPLPRQNLVKNAVARAVGTLTIPTATAMDVAPDGLRAIVLTYGDAYEYSRAATEDWKAAFARAPRKIAMPPRAQGESICYGLDGRTLYLTSEQAPSPLLQVSPATPKPAENSPATAPSSIGD
ncbi:MAG: hypothetical protein NTV86_14405 [Planctomycetota bacterium]|nr:hypothetical protein [Planctomycetota bacterium]